MTRIEFAIEQLVFARNYTLQLLASTKLEDWFRQPPGGVSNIAWQVGHVATSQYRLVLERFRGAKPEDAALIAPEFMKLFGKDSVPDPDPRKYPTAEEIRATFDRVYQQAMKELKTVDDAELDKPPLMPHALFKTKLWALTWCIQHETLHTGQIGLLRRLLGYGPNR